MMNHLEHRNWCLQLLLITPIVMALAETMDVDKSRNILLVDQPKPITFIEKLRPPPCIHKFNAENNQRSGLYVMWQKLLVRVSSEFKQSVLSKSFGTMKVAEGHEMEPIGMEEMRWRNIAAEVQTEKRIINAVLLLMKILLALDIAILLGVFIMLLGCFRKSKEPQVAEEVVKV